MSFFPTHTNFAIETIGAKKILVANTEYKDMIEAGIDKCTITTALGEVVDKEYPMPLKFRVIQDGIIFEDIEFIEPYRGSILQSVTRIKEGESS